MAEPPELTIRAGGRELTGWTSCRVSTRMDSAVPEFAIEMANARIDSMGRSYSTGVSADAVTEAADVIDALDDHELIEVLIGREVVITGYLDSDEFDYGGNQASIRVTGMARTLDLVDCTCELPAKGWTDSTVFAIARDVCEPFGISVSALADVGEPLKRFRIEPGETCMEVIARAAQMRRLVAMTDAAGDLVLTRAATGSPIATIELGRDILIGRATRNHRERFSEYHFRGQSGRSDLWNGKAAGQLVGFAGDAGVTRYRPLTILGVKQRTNEDLARRAAWESAVRYGRALRNVYTVPEWIGPHGALWKPNTLIRVVDPWSGVDDPLLCVGVEFMRDARGRVSVLDFMRPEAFAEEPVDASKERKRRKGRRRG